MGADLAQVLKYWGSGGFNPSDSAAYVFGMLTLANLVLTVYGEKCNIYQLFQQPLGYKGF